VTRIALASPARRLLIAATAAAAGAAFALSGSVSAGRAAAYPVVQPSAQDSVQVATGTLPPIGTASRATYRTANAPRSGGGSRLHCY